MHPTFVVKWGWLLSFHFIFLFIFLDINSSYFSEAWKKGAKRTEKHYQTVTVPQTISVKLSFFAIAVLCWKSHEKTDNCGALFSCCNLEKLDLIYFVHSWHIFTLELLSKNIVANWWKTDQNRNRERVLWKVLSPNQDEMWRGKSQPAGSEVWLFLFPSVCFISHGFFESKSGKFFSVLRNFVAWFEVVNNRWKLCL